MVAEGMEAERNNLRSFAAFELATWDDYRKTGGRVIGCRWVLRLKMNPQRVKARVVVQEVNTGTWRDSLAGTPAGAALRLLLWVAD